MTASEICWFRDLSIEDVPTVGGKNASLGEMVRELVPLGVAVPDGFAVTADAFRRYLRANELDGRIAERLAGLDARDTTALAAAGRDVRRWMLAGALPDDMAAVICEAYAQLSAEAGVEHVDVAVRSSATAEDLPGASFAGQQETYLNISGTAELLDACRRCFASLYTDRALAYRQEQGFEHTQVALSVGVQRMVRSDRGAAGVLFTLDPESGFRDVVVINAAYGLGENVVRGVVSPDEIHVFKPLLDGDHRPVVGRKLGAKEIKMVYDARGGSSKTRNVPVPASQRRAFAISDDDSLQLARWAVQIERHYSKRAGQARPMDIEWGKDGKTGELFILQARPETVQSRRAAGVFTQHRRLGDGPVLVRGTAVGGQIATGRARVVAGLDEIGSVESGDVLITEMTDPDWVPVMKRVSAIVTERGGRTCHAAIVSRELGIPAVVGAAHAMERVPDGDAVTVSCAEGETGLVFAGELEFESSEVSIADLPQTRTRVSLNVADPDRAFAFAAVPNAGVGLARMEFVINNAIGIHPLALLHPERVDDPDVRDAIAERIAGYPDGASFFVDQLALGIGKIAAAFYPKPVILRLSDFKSNEYAGLLGGAGFEPHEENPMIGFRGASRYTHKAYRDGFALECRAIRYVRERIGLDNLKVMVPFCRTPDEGAAVIAALAEHGLKQGGDGFEVYVMCEIPANVVLADRFAQLFDGFSIGSNDLTQLVLGIDRDSEILAASFDERNEAVKRMIAQAIREVHAAGKPIGICGQAPSDYPEFAAFLVECGIDSISLNPDAVVTTIPVIAAAEADAGA